MNNQLLELHLRQLDRLLKECPKMKFNIACYIVFSDNISNELLLNLITLNLQSSCFSENLHKIMTKEVINRKN